MIWLKLVDSMEGIVKSNQQVGLGERDVIKNVIMITPHDVVVMKLFYPTYNARVHLV
ncbi:hypothetical protein I3843_09G179800 [Carya illinoinensis]|nr:hypothetical protein I3843_09G179800 [Carya illinoinensis]